MFANMTLKISHVIQLRSGIFSEKTDLQEEIVAVNEAKDVLEAILGTSSLNLSHVP